MPEKKYSFIEKYAINFTEQEYVVNPAIGRDKEIKELALVLLTPDKSAILTGKPGIGKTAIVEGLAYLIQRNEVPDALKGYTIIKVDTQALVGIVQETGDSRVQTLINEILEHEKYILFIDEIHTLIGGNTEGALDFANMFKTGLGRGDLKIVGATTSAEYEKYILRDKAFTRRFQRIDIAEPDKDLTTKIVVGVIPRIEHASGIKMDYTPFIWEKLARFVVELTTEYNRVYETEGRYPDVPITIFSQAFSEALFENKNLVTATHIRKAIVNTKAVYPDVIKKYLPLFDATFKDLLDNDKRDHEGLVSSNSNTNRDAIESKIKDELDSIINSDSTTDSPAVEYLTESSSDTANNNAITNEQPEENITNAIDIASSIAEQPMVVSTGTAADHQPKESNINTNIDASITTEQLSGNNVEVSNNAVTNEQPLENSTTVADNTTITNAQPIENNAVVNNVPITESNNTNDNVIDTMQELNSFYDRFNNLG